MKFQHIHDAHGNILIEWLTGAAIKENALTAFIAQTKPQEISDLRFRGTVEHWRGHGHALFELTYQLAKLYFAQAIDHSGIDTITQDLLEGGLYTSNVLFHLHHARKLLANTLGGPAKMSFQNLPYVHTAW